MCRALDLEGGALVVARQVHGADTVTVTAPWGGGAPPEADALVTAVPGIALGLLTADCVPVLLADAAAGVVGAAHAGWRGALAGVIGAVVRAMEHAGATPAQTVSALGPHIRQEAYQVEAEFAERFLARSAAAAAFFSAPGRSGKRHFDLGGCVAAELAAEGVGSIEVLPHCTYRDAARFFSHRRCTRAGGVATRRQIAAIALTTA